jgi:MSHA pilin protein MshD
MPFTYCDPGDANARTATVATLGAGGCATTVDGLGPEGGETRYNPANRFDGITDYQGFSMPGPGCAGICDLAGTVINGPGSSLAGCSASVQLTPQAITSQPASMSIAALDANGQAQVLRIAVSVACPGMQPLELQGLNVRHAPNWF